MELIFGSDLYEPNYDILYQFEEGKRAHTIKFSPNKKEKNINININSLNNKRKIKLPQKNQNIKFKQNIKKEIILPNNKKITIKESNKISNDTSELEIIEYPIDEFKKNDNNINNANHSKDKNDINDKCQNNIINYLKNKPGFNRLNLLLDNESNSSRSNSEDIYNIRDDSSKSDEIICSYIEIDNNNSKQNSLNKEKNVINNSSKIFSQIHKATHNNYSFSLKYNNNSYNAKKTKKNIKINSNEKTKNDVKKLNNFKKIKKPNNNIIINKLIVNRRTMPQKEASKILKTKQISKKIFDVHNSKNKTEKILDKLKNIKSFRTIENQYQDHVKNKSLISEKTNIYPRKTYKLNTQIVKHNLDVNKTLAEKKGINSKEIYLNNRIFKTIKVSPNNKKIKKFNSKIKLIDKTNTLFNSIDIKKSQNLKKSNFLNFKKEVLNTKKKELNIKNIDSKGKLRKLLLLSKNNMDNIRQKFDISMNNINSINNNMKLLISREKYKTANKIMNKSEANKDINIPKKIKSQNKNCKKVKFTNNNIKDFIKRNSIYKIFK